VDRPGEVSLLVVARRLNLGLLSLDHPQRGDLGIGVEVDLVLEDGRLVLGQPGQQCAERVQLGLALLVGRPEGGARAMVDQVAAMQPAADRLATDLDIVLPEHPQRDGLAAPAAAEEAEVAGRLLGDPFDDGGDPGGREVKGTAGLVPGQALDPLVLEPLDPAVDGPGAAEQQGGDGGPGVAISQEQEDVGVEADLGVGVVAVSVEQRLALPGVKGDAAGHGASSGCWT
jgi:hypothetical protein